MIQRFNIVILFLLGALTLVPSGAQAQMMGGSSMGTMMWLMAAFWLLIMLGLVFGIAALVKYLFKK
ncbi:hypothetical protein [Castellaniella defragrans]|nr:hypothetical protein [Castellaniella defragrans]KAB0606547.1 hypothetical protein F7Q88_14230 [Castellaniella defragrans]